MPGADAKAGAKDDEDALQTTPSKVVIDLMNFAMRVVHEDMAPFFEEHCELWDYDEEQLKEIFSGSGESLQHHNIYTKYLGMINEHLDLFAARSGYSDAKGVIEAVQGAIEHDKKQREQMMKEIQAMFANMTAGMTAAADDEGNKTEGSKASAGAKDEEAEDADAKAGAKDEDEDEDKPETKGVDAVANNKKKKTPAGGGGGGNGGMFLFSQPIGLEYLLDSVLNLADYETLRMMMIMKVRERKMYAQLAKKGCDRRAATARRADALTSRCSVATLSSEYVELRTRLQELTPQRKDLHAAVAQGMPDAPFDDDARAAGARDACDQTLYDFPVTHLARMASPQGSADLEAKATDLRAQRASHLDWLTTLHAFIDQVHEEIEKCLLGSRRCPVSGGSAQSANAEAKTGAKSSD